MNGEEDDWEVVGFFQLAGKSGGYLAYANYDYLSDLIGQRNKAAAYRVVAQRGHDLTLEEQKELVRGSGSPLAQRGFDIAESTPGLELVETTTNGLKILTTFLLIMALLTALVGSIGLMGTMSLNVMERTREIGVLRAIGASDGAVIAHGAGGRHDHRRDELAAGLAGGAADQPVDVRHDQPWPCSMRPPRLPTRPPGS